MQFTAESDLVAIEIKSFGLNEFETLYNNVSNALYKYVIYYVNDEEVAKSIVNDLFVQLWFKEEQPINVKGYLYRAAKNASLNYLQRHKRNPISYLEQDELTLMADLNMQSSEVNFESSQLKFLQNLISSLPQRRQLVFKTHRLEGFSYAEIADLLQISVRTVEDHLSKSMQFIHAHAKHFIDVKLTEA